MGCEKRSKLRQETDCPLLVSILYVSVLILVLQSRYYFLKSSGITRREIIMIIGYARVSTLEQNLDLQLDSLKSAGCERVFQDHISGGAVERPGLAEALKVVRKGDTLVVWRLDRLGRSLKHLIDTVGALEAEGVGFRSITESIDTTTSGGKLVFHVFGALAEFERELIRERTKAGLAAARARGRVGGRPRKLDAKKVALAKTLLADQSQSVTDVAVMLGVGRATLYRALGRTVQGNTARQLPGV